MRALILQKDWLLLNARYQGYRPADLALTF